MALLRSNESIDIELKNLENRLKNEILSHIERRKVKNRISRLKRIDKERVNEEQRRRRLGKKKREKKKTKPQDIKKDIKPPVVVPNSRIEMETRLLKELAYIAADERVRRNDNQFKINKDTKVVKVRNKSRKCSNCRKAIKTRTYTSIEHMNNKEFYCEECAKKIKGLFEIEV